MIMTVQRLVIVVLPPSSQRDRIVELLRHGDRQLRCFSRVEEFLFELRAAPRPGHFCVVSELSGIGMSGLAFQQELRKCCHASSIIFCGRRPQPSDIVKAMRQGAVAVVDLSADLSELTSYVAEGIDRCVTQFCRENNCRETIRKLRSLSVGERQVLQGILAGRLNKEIAKSLELSIRTIEQRRREVFRKMEVHHPASLARMVIEAAQMTRIHAQDDEQTQWLGGMRSEIEHTGSLPNGTGDRQPSRVSS